MKDTKGALPKVKKKRKILFVMVDGLGDVSVPAFGYRTPLQQAKTPHMDYIAAAGRNGLMDPVQIGLACGSDTAHLSVFGYPPQKYYNGRGALETMGTGLEMKPGDIAFKSIFSTLDPESGIIIRRRADKHFEDIGPILCAALNKLKLPDFPDHEIDVKYATEHRCAVRVRGPGLSDKISNTDPLKDMLPLLESKPKDDSPEAEMTSMLANSLSRAFVEILSVHPINIERKKKGLRMANIVLLRGCGVVGEVEPFYRRHALKAFMVAPTCIIRGIGISVGFDLIEAPGATGDYNTNLSSKAKVGTETLIYKDYDFGFVHVKAVDDAGHDRDPDLKVTWLERVDEMLREIIERLWEEEQKSREKVKEGRMDDGEELCCYNICLTGDHSTPALYGDHSCEPVPFVIARIKNVAKVMKEVERKSKEKQSEMNEEGKNNIKLLALEDDPVVAFDEISAAQGSLGRFPGREVMPLIKHFLGRDVGEQMD